ncbi:MAG: hypothetical protein Q8880_03960 [Bacteroidota bacterium]|nr:hypothetical protein [Bacteroidota bacterium]
MKKTVLTIGIAFLCFLFMTKGYSQITIGATGGFMVPLGDFGKTNILTTPMKNYVDHNGKLAYNFDAINSQIGFSIGAGGGLSCKFFLKENIAAGISAGAYSFGAKDVNSSYAINSDLKLIPVMVSGEYYLLFDKIKPYAGVELGVLMAKEKLKYYSPIKDEVGAKIDENDYSSTKTYFGLAPIIGCTYSFCENLDLNANVKLLYGFSKVDDLKNKGDQPYNYMAFGFNIGISYKIMNKNKSFL